jgi:hypothetical protein
MERNRSVEDLILGWPFQMSSVVVRKKNIAPLPAWLRSLPMGDWPIQIMAALHGEAIFVDQVMSCYRLHAGGIWSASATRDHYGKAAEALRIMSNHFPSKYRATFRASERNKCLDGIRAALAAGRRTDALYFSLRVLCRFGVPIEIFSPRRILRTIKGLTTRRRGSPSNVVNR